MHATEDIHFAIEELLVLYGVYYDRRKGKNRLAGRPISKIVSMRKMAQAVMSIALWRPDDARARPETVLKRDPVYFDTFDVSAPRELFVSCILIDKQVTGYLAKKDGVSSDLRVDIRYYMDAWVGAVLCGSAQPTKAAIAGLTKGLNNTIEAQILDDAFDKVLGVYSGAGGNDRAAKGPQMKESLLQELKKKYG